MEPALLEHSQEGTREVAFVYTRALYAKDILSFLIRPVAIRGRNPFIMTMHVGVYPNAA